MSVVFLAHHFGNTARVYLILLGGGKYCQPEVHEVSLDKISTTHYLSLQIIGLQAEVLQNSEEECEISHDILSQKHQPDQNELRKDRKKRSLLWGNLNNGFGTYANIRFHQWLEPYLLQKKSTVFTTKRCRQFQGQEETALKRQEPCAPNLLTWEPR